MSMVRQPLLLHLLCACVLGFTKEKCASSVLLLKKKTKKKTIQNTLKKAMVDTEGGKLSRGTEDFFLGYLLFGQSNKKLDNSKVISHPIPIPQLLQETNMNLDGEERGSQDKGIICL